MERSNPQVIKLLKISQPKKTHKREVLIQQFQLFTDKPKMFPEVENNEFRGKCENRDCKFLNIHKFLNIRIRSHGQNSTNYKAVKQNEKQS